MTAIKSNEDLAGLNPRSITLARIPILRNSKALNQNFRFYVQNQHITSFDKNRDFAMLLPNGRK